MADDDQARRAGHRRAAVHHAGPLAQLGLLRRARAEDMGDGSRGQADDGAGGAAEEEAKARVQRRRVGLVE